MADGVKLGEKAIEQLGGVVHHGRLRYQNDQPAQPKRTVSQAPIWQHFRPTSGPDVSGIYTGVLEYLDTATLTWITLATGVKGYES